MTYEQNFKNLWLAAKALADEAPTLKPQSRHLPPLFFFTDPERTPRPELIAPYLPRDTAIVYRHFGESGAYERALRLKILCIQRKLLLFIGNDIDLALRAGADGVHLPQKRWQDAKTIRKSNPKLMLTLAGHDGLIVPDIDKDNVDGLFLSPLFKSQSRSAEGMVTLRGEDVLSLSQSSPLALFGLGGINHQNMGKLTGLGLRGFGAVEAFKI
jgi:thiamine-phosphate pyrophosphorylase